MRGRLTIAPSTPLAGDDRFGCWLNGPRAAPVAVALSGGGDSLALLHMAHVWAATAGRPLLALTVDHGLQNASAAWARFAAAVAARLGVAHCTLTWTGAKPATGLPAAARAARHALLAEAAQGAGARVILMGHTADDLIEAALMREAGGSVPSPRTWSPSPAWPEGRGVFLLRPLLDLRRAELRAYLRSLGETWIDDPANDDPRYARSLARRQAGDMSVRRAALALASNHSLPRGRADTNTNAASNALPSAPLLKSVLEDAGGGLTLPRAAFREPGAARLLGALALCAAGTRRPPAAASLARLALRLAAAAPVAATLAGARIEARGERVLVCREAGEEARGGLAAYDAPIGESMFDGRFLIQAAAAGWRIAPLAGLARQLPLHVRAALRSLPPSVRAALPAAISPGGEVACPALSATGPVHATPLNRLRLLATLGAVPDEAAIWRVAKPHALT